MITQTLVLHLVPDSVRPRVYLNQYDTGLSRLNFDLVDVNTYYTIPSGTRCLFIGTKSDRTMFSYACTYSGHRVTCDVTEQMTMVPGTVNCELRMIGSNNTVVGSINIDMYIERSPLQFGKLSCNDFKSADEEIISIHAEVQDARVAADNANTAYQNTLSLVNGFDQRVNDGISSIVSTVANGVITVNNTIDAGLDRIDGALSIGYASIVNAVNQAVYAYNNLQDDGVALMYDEVTGTFFSMVDYDKALVTGVDFGYDTESNTMSVLVGDGDSGSDSDESNGAFDYTSEDDTLVINNID